MSLKVYVAGKVEDKERVREIQTQLRQVGHTITLDWTTASQDSRQQALKDIRGVADADVFVGVFEEDYAYRGTLVEMGAALALGKPVYILGNATTVRRCIFMKHPNVRQGKDAFERDLIVGAI